MKDQVISYLNNIQQLKKARQDRMEQLRKLTQQCSKKDFNLCILSKFFFAVVRAGWEITKTYTHYTFEQERFNKNFILMNQKSRQNAKNSVEKDFYKLMNNSNFGYDCKNNLDNCQFVPIYDELKEITYIKKHNFSDPKVSKFVTPDLIAQEIEEKFNDDMIKLSK